MMLKIKGVLSHSLTAAVAVIASLTFTAYSKEQQTAAPSGGVYLIGAVTVTDPERLPEYQAIAGPLAGSTGGYVPLAFSQPNLIEGDLQHPQSGYFIERYDSLEGLNAFLNSPEFQQAKKLRDQVADVHFMMWLPELEEGALPH
jgi:uncharacterized protein (DUF1330 family)